MVQGPQSRYGSAMAALGGAAVVYGGSQAQPGAVREYDLWDTWVWNASVWTQAADLSPPLGRHRHAMATRFAR